MDWTTEDAGSSAVTGISLLSSDGDYLSGSGTLSFAKGEMEKTLSFTGVPYPGGLKDGEFDEFFHVKLYNPRSSYSNIQITGSNPYSVFIVEPS